MICYLSCWAFFISSEALSHFHCRPSQVDIYTTCISHVGFIPLLQLSKQILNKLSTAGVERGEGVGWAAATARLHPIRAGSVEKGCGLEPVTSVPFPSALAAFCRVRQGEESVYVCVYVPRRSSRSAAALFAKSPTAAQVMWLVYPSSAPMLSGKRSLCLSGIFLLTDSDSLCDKRL